MRKIPQFIAIMFILYLLMQGWNTTMYHQFPALIIANYWIFCGLIIAGWFILRVIKTIK